jgi:adrenodoxin-NADP+ reductase
MVGGRVPIGSLLRSTTCTIIDDSFRLLLKGHPNYDHIGDKVARALGGKDGVRDSSVVVIGHGNVALDCARVLAKASPGLYDTDLAARALPVLGDGVSHISIVGRRGHVQGAFTIKELRELVKLEEEGHGTSFVVREDELDMGATPASLEELNGPHGRPRTRIDKLLRETASRGRCTSKCECARFELCF